MRYHRAVFAAGVAVGFIAGSRAGRERYDQIVKYSRKAMQSPPVQRATQALSGRAADLSKSAAAKAADLSKSAVARAPKAAGSAARKARDRAGKVKDQAGKVKDQAGKVKERAGKVSRPKVHAPKVTLPKPGRFRATSSVPATATTKHSVNGNGQGTTPSEN